MDDFDAFLRYIKSQEFYNGQIVHIETLPELKARYGN